MTFPSKYSSLLVGIALVGMVLTLACGKKGPPLPLEKPGNTIAAPVNLTYTIEKDQLSLAWDHTPDPVNAKISPEAFVVYGAVKNEKECQGCPFVFEKAGQVAMPAMVYRQALTPGPLYYFRVQAIGKNGVKSDFSTPIQIEFD